MPQEPTKPATVSIHPDMRLMARYLGITLNDAMMRAQKDWLASSATDILKAARKLPRPV